MTRKIILFISFALAVAVVWFFLALPSRHVYAHFSDRPDLNGWAAQLRDQSGAMCCSFADAEALTDVQWDTQEGHYRVYLDDHWMDVPDRAVISVPNRYGAAVVWPLRYNGKAYDIRCFIPGAGS